MSLKGAISRSSDGGPDDTTFGARLAALRQPRFCLSTRRAARNEIAPATSAALGRALDCNWFVPYKVIA
jgi:hypothetical protein